MNKKMAACKYLCLVIYLATLASAAQVTYDARNLLIDGVPKVILSGSIHYPRSTVQMWPDLIQKAKEGGLDTIEIYIFWDRHERSLSYSWLIIEFLFFFLQYDFSGNLDFIRFFKTVQEAGMYAILRIGPYVCAEWSYGGFPVWLHNLPGIQLRTDNQIENEYGNIMNDYKEAGKSYIKWCAKMAESQNIGVPWIMCQQNDAPQPMINTCNGFCCDDFKPNNPKSPKMWTENWTGWFKSWDGANPHRTAEDVAFAVARFFQTGGVLQNYYMYHGGTNFGRTAGGPYITTSYDYDAPLDEYGNKAQPKWGHLKKLHEVIKAAEVELTAKSVTEKDVGSGVTMTKYSSKSGQSSFCFLSNTDNKNDGTVELVAGGAKYFVPAWSVSFLTNCTTEVYNTAKVNTQTSIMVKKPSESGNLAWSWKSEPMKDTLKGSGPTNSTKLLEQKATTVDASDYLWYMTRLGVVFDKPVRLKAGNNQISLLSATVGLANYGPFFDLKPTGIAGGPVTLAGAGDVSVTKDLSSNLWSYKVGLNGETKKFYDVNTRNFNSKWSEQSVSMNRAMTWYKATFQAPLGRDPVVVDLNGMGKGHAWVNGHSIRRFCDTCDYRGKYKDKKCLTNCGKSTQRYYHIPRSFLLDDASNTLVLFEEIGGNPTQVNFQTVTVGKACGNVLEGNTLELSCQGGRRISDIEFASFGDPQGTCEAFKKGTCESDNSLSVVQKACVGKESCLIDVSEKTLGTTKCSQIARWRLAVQAVC
ncbi:hypothetical protein ACHQM5_028721 [Ranunculus cassubicifolius]